MPSGSNKAIELDSNNASAYAIYTEILLDEGNFEDIQTAIDMSQKAQALDPNALETLRARGYVLFNTGNFDEAIQAIGRLLQSTTSCGICITRWE